MSLFCYDSDKIKLMLPLHFSLPPSPCSCSFFRYLLFCSLYIYISMCIINFSYSFKCISRHSSLLSWLFHFILPCILSLFHSPTSNQLLLLLLHNWLVTQQPNSPLGVFLRYRSQWYSQDAFNTPFVFTGFSKIIAGRQAFSLTRMAVGFT